MLSIAISFACACGSPALLPGSAPVPAARGVPASAASSGLDTLEPCTLESRAIESCATELSTTADPTRAGDELAELAKDLQSSGDWWESKRRTAVRKLAELGTPAAWELVIGALEQPSAQVADEAELALENLSDKKLLGALLGSKGLAHKELAVRVRAAEACGRIGAELDAGVLAREARGAKEPELRRTLAWTLERRARAARIADADTKRVIDVLQALATRDAAPEVRGAALGALVALQKDAAATAIAQALTDKLAVLRCAGLEQCEVLGAARAEAESARLLDAAEPRVRTAALDRLEALATRGAVLAIATRLEKEQQPALAWRMRELLHEFSGVQQEWEPSAWRHWAEELPLTWQAQRAASGDSSSGSRGAAASAAAHVSGTRAPVQLVGMPIVSSRLAILIDLSGSVWDTVRDGKTRKQLLDVELRAALEKLPTTTAFNLIPYTSKPLRWADVLQPATPANVKRALEWFEARKDRGKGNFWDAALLALEDPSVDTVLVLTDGAPTGGSRWNMELMTEWLAQENRFRRARFDSILIDAPKALQKHWQRMAEQSHGYSIAVAMKP